MSNQAKRKHPVLGIVLTGMGILIFLSVLGLNLGNLIRLGIAVLIFYFAWNLFTKRSNVGAIILTVIGSLMLLSSLDILIGLGLSALLMYYGMRLYKKGLMMILTSSFHHKALNNPL
ncbi:hypothetical protein G4V62_15880 [Bacillaceae bacterium SIJ1]|uniref:hypothetical protein n=1 Tax=Litoribacterium kuwaitense TaxID=1398745 RepID=UPI0013ED3FE4|nr:hypothetical protein [Litoribacterium kuwaitense]NGP46351.1 hypothetical protein [Litoribacterium kuwaitense]